MHIFTQKNLKEEIQAEMSKNKEESNFEFINHNWVKTVLQQNSKWQKQQNAAYRIEMGHFGPSYKDKL
jgi:hypothetical protein